MRIGRLTIDLGGRWASAVAAVKRKVGGAATVLSKGVGIKAGTWPMSSYKRKLGERHGEHWYMPQTRGTREFPYVAIDTNYWKSFIHTAFLTPAGDPGAMTIYGQPDDHALFASHITAETFKATSGDNRNLQEWTLRPMRPDNHWLDASVYAAVAASMQGIKLPNREDPAERQVVVRERKTLVQLAQEAKR
jgi:phage terminase large subunit GpA-like protein